MNQNKPVIINGIPCYSPQVDSQHNDYPESGLKKLYELESKHFWFISRYEFIIKTITKRTNSNCRFIEIGAGTGNVSRKLMDKGFKPAVGEIHLSGLQYAKSYGITECYQFDLYNTPFSDCYDAIGLFDVLEHLDKPEKALSNINSMLRDNGLLYITVPAHMWLWNKYDRLAGHKIRYTKPSLIQVAQQANFDIIECRYFFIFITPLLWLRSKLHPDKHLEATIQEEDSEIHVNTMINKTLLAICRLENLINHLLPNIFGGSLILVVRKRANKDNI